MHENVQIKYLICYMLGNREESNTILNLKCLKKKLIDSPQMFYLSMVSNIICSILNITV